MLQTLEKRKAVEQVASGRGNQSIQAKPEKVFFAINKIIPQFTVKVKDNDSGLLVNSARYEIGYTANNNNYLKGFSASCTGSNGTTSLEQITIDIAKLHNHVLNLAEDGLRVIGIAKSYFHASNLPDGQHDFTFSFLGLLGFADPIRSEVPDSIRECQSAGIRVIIITGDYSATAQRVAGEIGLNEGDKIFDRQELNEMTDEDLGKKIGHVSIFARAVPDQKLRIVNALKGNQHTVAMTGDGVNDAPALKAADIGIAMGAVGTDVAIETADIALMTDELEKIPTVIRLSRKAFG
jgi:magnesium-transporting ATPase (P-type)